jgi:tryptophan-rich sensory protein
MIELGELWGWPLAIAAFGWAIVALLGGLVTEIGPWYRQLRKPWFQPPDWLFGPAWTLIFILTALATAECWIGARSSAEQGLIVAAFVLNGVLNVLWSILFFKMRRPDWALAEVGVLWLSVASMMLVALPISGQAVLFLAPYLAWVTFAAVLNLAIVRRNPNLAADAAEET